MSEKNDNILNGEQSDREIVEGKKCEVDPKEENLKKEEQEITPEIIEKMARENPSVVREMFMGIMKSPMYPPFLDKIEKEHISQALNTMDKQVDNDYKDKQSSKKYTVVYVILGIALFVFLTVYFINTNNKDFLMEIIKIIILLGGGGFGGFGISEIRHKKND
jgi:hypothetical protein